MNFKKVEIYIWAKLAEYKDNYPAEIFEGLEVEACSGSFGACLIYVKNKITSISHEYVGNYAAIDEKISRFVCRCFDVICERAYWREKKENDKGMKCTLYIYNDNKLVNTIEYKTAAEVKSQLVKIMIADKRRGVRTTYKPKPYSNDITIIEKWSREEAGTTCAIKYRYEFINIDY